MSIDQYLNYYTKEEIKQIAIGLTNILDKYDADMVAPDSQPRLMEKLVEILEVILSLTESIAQNYRYSNVNHNSYRPVSQLQSLKDALIRTQSRHLDISFKIPGKPFKVDDPLVSKWIREQLIKAFNDFDIPVEFGEAMFLLDSTDNPVKSDEKRTILSTYSVRPISFGKAVHLFCDSLMTYLSHTFKLTPHQAKYLSETQISFLYEVLGLMGFDTFSNGLDLDGKPLSTERDRLYAMLNLQQRVKR